MTLVLGQTTLGRLSDRFGRRPVIVAGTFLSASFYVGLAVATSFSLIMLVAVVAGMGGALTAPAVSAFYLDITAERHRSRILGIKGSAASLGGVTGPLLVAGVSAMTTPQGVFSIAGILTVSGTVLAFAFLRQPRRAAAGVVPRPSSPGVTGWRGGQAWAVSGQRAIAAQAALHGVVLRARAAREANDEE